MFCVLKKNRLIEFRLRRKIILLRTLVWGPAVQVTYIAGHILDSTWNIHCRVTMDQASQSKCQDPYKYRRVNKKL